MSDSPLASLAWAELCRARRYDIARALDLVRGLREGLRKPEEIRIADLAADLFEAGVEAEEAESEARELRELADLAVNLAIDLVDAGIKPKADDWLKLRGLALGFLDEAVMLGQAVRLPDPPAQAGAAA